MTSAPILPGQGAGRPHLAAAPAASEAGESRAPGSGPLREDPATEHTGEDADMQCEHEHEGADLALRRSRREAEIAELEQRIRDKLAAWQVKRAHAPFRAQEGGPSALHPPVGE